MINRRQASYLESEAHVAPFVQTLGQLFYYQLRLIQVVEEQFGRGLRPGPAGRGAWSGDLICDVGIVNALDAARDPVFSVNRTYIHGFIRGDDVDKFIDDARTGHSLRMSEHWSSWRPDPATLCSPALNDEELIAGVLQTAVVAKECKSDAVNVAFVGDSPATCQKVVHSLQAARWWSLPILFVINRSSPPPRGQYAQEFTSEGRERSVNHHLFSPRNIVADDVFKVYAFASAAVAYVRRTGRPFLLHLESPCADEFFRTPADRSPETGSWSTGHALWKVAQKLSPREQENIDAYVARRLASVLQHSN